MSIMMKGRRFVVLFAAVFMSCVTAFVTPARHVTGVTQQPTISSPLSTSLDMIDVASASVSMEAAATAWTTSGGTSQLMAFTDQGQNLAGIFFQASLLPYLLFLYFLSFRAPTESPRLENFGFQFVLLFVMSTIPSGIISKAVYGTSLANVDWLHGGAETLLTVANVLIVLGFKQAMTTPVAETAGGASNNINDSWTPRLVALGIAGIFAASCATLTGTLEAHSAFLGGAGNVPDVVLYNSLTSWINHAEPSNALSIPTWAIHFSSVLEYLFAMNLVWKFAETTGQAAWRGLTWGMLPLHASGICACTYHWFYNAPELQFLVTSQAGLTLLGNLTCFIAAYRIARANGWTVQELVPWGQSTPTSPAGLVADGLAMKDLEVKPDLLQPTPILATQLVGATLALSYVTKYGELALDTPFEPNAALATAMILGIPALTAVPYALQSKAEDPNWGPLQYFPQMGGENADRKPALSMADVKKYGISGTVAYVLTELAFWIIAFPVAATALYQSTGHWPDVVSDANDRAAVLAFIFAGANIARLLVPLRLGAALALAPWVDENLLSGKGSAEAAAAAAEDVNVVSEQVKP